MKEEEKKKVIISQAERETRFAARREELMSRFIQAENLSAEILIATKECPQETETILKIGREARELKEKKAKEMIAATKVTMIALGTYQTLEQEFMYCLAKESEKYPNLLNENSVKEWLRRLDVLVDGLGDVLSKFQPFEAAAKCVVKELAESVKRRMKQAAQRSALKAKTDKIVNAVVADLKGTGKEK